MFSHATTLFKTELHEKTPSKSLEPVLSHLILLGNVCFPRMVWIFMVVHRRNLRNLTELVKALQRRWNPHANNMQRTGCYVLMS